MGVIKALMNTRKNPPDYFTSLSKLRGHEVAVTSQAAEELIAAAHTLSEYVLAHLSHPENYNDCDLELVVKYDMDKRELADAVQPLIAAVDHIDQLNKR